MEYDAFEPNVYRTAEEMKYIISNMLAFNKQYRDGFMPYLWNKMFKTCIARRAIIDVDERIRIAEDRDFLYRYVLKCNSVVIVRESFYFYRYVSTSAMRSINSGYMHELNALYLSLESVFLAHPEKESLIFQLQIYIASRVNQITERMGFHHLAQSIKYVCPLQNKLSGKRLVLYGAGKVGKSYYRQFCNKNDVLVCLWVDRNWEMYQREGLEIERVEKIKDTEYDYIIIAVAEWEVQNEIRNELFRLGVENEKIWWEKPISTER